MKKNFLVLALVILSFGAYSQKIEIQNASNYSRNKEIDKAVDCIERATTNEETKNDCKAWYLKGKILLQLDDMYSMVKIAREGMTEKEYNKALAPFNPTDQGAPLTPETSKNIKNSDGTKTKKAIYIYDVTAYFKDGKLIEATEPSNGKYLDVYKPSILDCAVEAFDKAIKIGTEEEFVNESYILLKNLENRYYNQAVNYYNAKQFLDAARSFERTNYIAEKYFNSPSAENKAYAEECYRYQVVEDLKNGDTATALKNIAEGLEKYSDNVSLMLQEAQIYLEKGENEKVIEKLEKVTKIDDSNPTLYFIIGQSYANLNNEEKAIDAYKKVLEMDPEHFETNYNLASVYFNKGTDLYEQANSLPFDAPEEQYQNLIDESTAWFEKAVPYLEIAADKAPEDLVILQALRSVYTRLKRNDDAIRITNQMKEIQAKEAE